MSGSCSGELGFGEKALCVEVRKSSQKEIARIRDPTAPD